MSARARHRGGVGRRRRRILTVLVTALVLGIGSIGHAYWTASSTGSYAKAQAATLAAPTVTAGATTATSVALGWSTTFSPTGLALTQSAGVLSGCSSTPAAASSSCTATGLTPNTSYTWTLTASKSNWTSAGTVTATTSRQATSTTLSNLTPTSGSQGASFAATATVAGYGTPAGTVTFSLFTSSSCAGAASYSTSALSLASGSVTGTLQPAAGTYYWRATYTPSDAYNLSSPSSCSSAITVTAPTSTIGLNYYNVSLTNYNPQGRPTAFQGSLSVINGGGSVLRTFSTISVTASYPDTRVSGAAPTSTSGVGWTYQGSSHAGSTWVYSFGWTGSLTPYASTDSLVFTVDVTDNSPGTASSTATASNPFTNTATYTLTGSF
jgi:hypothetical protein